MIVTLLGASGNMGECVTQELVKREEIDIVRIFAHSKKNTEKLVKKVKKYKNKIEVIYGSVGNVDSLKKAFEGSSYVVNMAGVIPPLSDKRPDLAIASNEIGPKNVCKAIEELGDAQPKLIHISTIGTYGDRNEKTLFGEVGDPLLPSPLDIYSITKVRGEHTVLESDVKMWAVIRQTAVLYDKLLFKNVSDGLMFHTCFNSPLEWVTAKDSGVLIRNIILRDIAGHLDTNNFWNHCFNLGGGEENRITGFDTLELGFKIIGATTEQFFDTNYNATRNFHGIWFSDGQKLEELFTYQSETVTEFWDNVLKKHPYFVLARIIPKRLLKKLIIKPLLKDDNAPMYWVKNNDKPMVDAYFGSMEDFEAIPKDWKDFPLIAKNTHPDVKMSYEEVRRTPTYLYHGFDLHKPLSEITIEDLQSVAKAHGGKLLEKEFKTGDVYRKVRWEDQDGNEFCWRPYTVLGCGHWHNISYEKYAWDFDRLSKKDEIYAQVWYCAHRKDENKFYYYDENFKAIEEVF